MRLRAALGAVLLLMASVAWADFARVGPSDLPSPPGNGFPKWYQDLDGLVLDLCLPDAGDVDGRQKTACLLEINPPYTFPTNFPDEAFYFRATTALDTTATPTTPTRAVLVLALEAAFANGAAAPGDQVVFARIRVTAGVPHPGTYFVTHPWGNETFLNVQASGARDIVFTEDVGITAGQFALALKGRAGPFLTRVAAPKFVTINGAQFLSDGVAQEQVTGSRFGTNYFEICGPYDGPDTYRCFRTDLFTLTGRVHDLVASPIGSPLTISRATYARNLAGQTLVDVSATAVAGIGQAAPVLSAATPSVSPVLMRGPDALGHFYAQGIPLPAGSVPGAISVINSGDNPPSLATRALVDTVTIASAVYDPAGTLTVVATSSDKGLSTATPPLPPPALALDGYPGAVMTTGAIFGDPASVQLVASGITVPPTEVVVVSSAGGIGRAEFLTTTAGPFSAGAPLAIDDVASATAGTGAISIAVTGNDVVPGDTPLLVNPATSNTVTILPPGLAPANLGGVVLGANGSVQFQPGNIAGTATFRYTVQNSVGVSNPATVTITIAPGASPVPVAANDPTTGTINVSPGQAVTILVLSNDSTNGGAPLDPTSVQVSRLPAVGTATVTTTGAITYTSPIGSPLGAQTFEYTVANTSGVPSAPATVTVTVVAQETIGITRARCRAGAWDVRGTASTNSSSVTLFNTPTVPVTPTPTQVLGTVPVDATGVFTFRATAACVPQISIKTSQGTVRTNIPVDPR